MPLQSLDFIDTGNTFPPFDERKRLNSYRNAKLLYEGHHDHVFHRWARTSGVDNLTVIVNWHRRLSILWADMLFGQPPEIKGDNQEVVNELVHSNDFNERLYESAIDVSRFGTGLLKVRYDGRAIIEAVPADIWFPVVDPANVKTVTAHVLAWKYKDADDNSFLNVEIHERGRVEYRTYSLAGDNGISVLLESEEEFTGIDRFLVRPINNVTSSDKLIGTNDYDDINSLLEEIEMRLTQISRVLDTHADPSMYGDEAALEFNERTGEYVVRGGGKFYPISDESLRPGYITWDANLTDNQDQVDKLMEQFYVVTNTSPASFGQLKSGLAESGSALRRLLMATVIKSNRMQVRFSSAIKDVMEIAGELNARNGGQTTGSITVEFVDVLPVDGPEQVQNETLRYQQGLTSLEAALGRLDGISGEALQNEINAIQAQEADNDGNDE